MKKVIYILTALLVFNSCGLLDISPREQMPEDEMFSSETGFKQALIGVYTRMASADLYGRNTTFYLPELLAQTWVIGDYAGERDESTALKEWDFTHSSVESRIDTIYTSYYKAIAELNNILDHIDGAKNVFSNGNYELIKGEALGLRAFLHLDLLRLFGPIPSQGTGKDAVPYVDKFTLNPNDYTTDRYETVVGRIIEDLDDAEELLAGDPFLKGTVAQTQFGDSWDERPADSWQDGRQVRFNIYAVQAAKARYYDWIGNSAKAVEYAEKVIGSEKFALVTEAALTASNAGTRVTLAFIPEHIFGLHNPKHQTVINPYFVKATQILTQTSTAISTAYEASQTDIRNITNRFWKTATHSGYSGTLFQFMKYSGNDLLPSENKIPMLRVSEMYLIALANLNHGDARIEQYFTEFAVARNLPESFITSVTGDHTFLLEQIEKEYRKDFMGEGHMFYYYKKHNRQQYSWPTSFSVPAEYSGYVIPKPQGQLMFE